mgnify:CR=1 FL=1
MAQISIAELVKIASKLLNLSKLPEWADALAVRQWLGAVLDLLSEIASITKTEQDDDIVEVLEHILADDAVYDGVYQLIYKLATGGYAASELVYSDTPPVPLAAIDPRLLMVILQVVKVLIEYFSEK